MSSFGLPAHRSHRSRPVSKLPSVECLARRPSRVRIVLAPQFCASVRGITSSALRRARYGHCCTLMLDACCGEQHGGRHLRGAASQSAWRGFGQHVARHVHGVLQVALHLVEDVLAGAAQQDRARLRVLALVMTCSTRRRSSDFEESGAGAECVFPAARRSGSPTVAPHAPDPVVVRLAHAPDGECRP